MPYKEYYSGRMWHLKNQRTGKVINVPSAKSREDAIRVGRIREAYSHGWKPTKVRKHARRLKWRTVGVKEHSRKVRKCAPWYDVELKSGGRMRGEFDSGKQAKGYYENTYNEPVANVREVKFRDYSDYQERMNDE